MQSKNSIIKNKVPIRFYEKIGYVLAEDILKIKGKQWFDRYCEVAGPGNTGIVIPPNHSSHKKKDYQHGIYVWDFERFSKVVDRGIPTYWD